METNEAPEKLYLINDVDVTILSYDPSTKLQGCRYDFVDKEVFPIEEGCEVEYTRTDAFIEKAAEWLNETLRNTDFYENEIELMVNEFKKAMRL